MRKRIKRFSIQEGHYTGKKKLKKIPGAIETITKAALVGLGLGTAVGLSDKDKETSKFAKKGLLTGIVSGAIMKLLINSFHKPLSTVNYDQVDRYLRLKYNIDKFIPGNNKSSERIVFNNSEVEKYQINISILKKSIQLYITGFSNEELSALNSLLDDYCYNYFGMEYSSNLINKDKNSYSISIIFTNHLIITEFILKLLTIVPYTVNVLNNKVTIPLYNEDIKLSKPEIKLYSSGSLPLFDKYAWIKILSKGGLVLFKGNKTPKEIMFSIFSEIAEPAWKTVLLKNLPVKYLKPSRKDLNNHFLEKALKDLGGNYTISRDVNDDGVNLYIISGILFICISKGNSNKKKLESILDGESNIIKSSLKEQVILWKYSIDSESGLKSILKKIINLNIKPNIYTR